VKLQNNLQQACTLSYNRGLENRDDLNFLVAAYAINFSRFMIFMVLAECTHFIVAFKEDANTEEN